MTDVSAFYDEYADQQAQTGINARHRSIMEFLVEHGLEENHKVLEIGAGIGTQTQLIANYLSEGSITMNDISERSVAMAKERLQSQANISFVAGDIVTEPISTSFDGVVCPDVLEHIPVDQHAALFKKFDQITGENGTIYIHIPSPYFMTWQIKNQPEVLQIIDQELHTDQFIKNLEGTSFYIHHLETYALFYHGCDYQFIVLKKRNTTKFTEIVNPGVRFHKRVLKRLKLAGQVLFTDAGDKL